MPVVKLPDGKELNFDSPITVADVAQSIGPGLFKAAIAGKVNEKLVDTSFLIESDCDIAIVTAKDNDGLEIIRHSCAHLMAQAVQSLFDGVQVTIGPVIENGFYYDFAYSGSFTEEDFDKIESKMKELVKSDLKTTRTLMTRDEAIKLFQDKKEDYKVKIIQDIPSNEPLSFYQHGDFIDLCRGPHIPSTRHLKAFKLLKVSGAYWRGDSNNEMLQRIYGTAWPDKKQLDAYLNQLEEAKKRDHRKIGKKLDLFHMQEEAPGMVFWHPNGWNIVKELKGYIANTITKQGYQEVNTPQVVDRTLWEKSGHWEVFRENMYTVSVDDRHSAIKPMNCPCHVQIYNQGVKSYRDLPYRIAEFGSCHRYEPSGALHGIMRLRNFVQDDAHIFCTEDQIEQEVIDFIGVVQNVYKDFGFEDIIIRLSTRPEKRVGSDEIWDKSERALENAINKAGLVFELYPGEGAFYGPKIEFSLKDSIGRIWQCGTIQVDFSMPGRLDATYIAEDGNKKVPVMLHRAILGSIERFVGILIEETTGSFPLWLAPIQLVICNISEKHDAWCNEINQNLSNMGFRVKKDLRNEKIGFKIREHSIQRIPYFLVVGDREVGSQTVSVRTRDGEDLGSMDLNSLVLKLNEEIEQRGRKKN